MTTIKAIKPERIALEDGYIMLVEGQLQAPDIAFNILNKELEWIRAGSTPRDEYYANDANEPYAYKAYGGTGLRTYQPQPWTPILRQLQQEAQFWSTMTGRRERFEAVFLNRYRDGKDQLGWHSDDSPEMDPARPIIIISLGAERELWFRKKPSTDPLNTDGPPPVTKVRLTNGSICVMPPGLQQTHQHRVPRSDRQDCGPRISLTFRGYIKPAR